MGKGGGLSVQMPGIFESSSTALQSDAMSGQIYGGTSGQRAEASSLASGGPGGSKSSGPSLLGPGLAVGSAALDALDDDPGYGGMDVGKEALKFASMGAVAGPIGAGVGAVIGAGIGLIKKGKYEKEQREKKRKERSNKLAGEEVKATSKEAEDFFANQVDANTGLYGGKQVDMFINKYAQ